MAVITKQELEDAAADAFALERIVNGSATENGTGVVTTRLGQQVKTAAKIASELANVDIGGSAVAQINQKIDQEVLDRQAGDSSVVALGRLARNSGADYPLRSANRGGVVSSVSTPFNDLLLDVRVFNAQPSKFYRVAYQQNFADLDGEQAYDWIIEEFDQSTYSSSGVGTIIVGYQKATYGEQQQLNRTGGIQTIRLYPVNRPRMRIDITLDASKLPAQGTPINVYASSGYPGYSWIIDPSCYVLEDTTVLRNSDVVPANLIAQDRLTLHKGKSYPLKQMMRDGITSNASSVWNNTLLDIQVIGARPGKYYQVSYMQNGASLVGDTQYDWMIREFDSATFDTNAGSGIAVTNYTDASQPQLNPTSGIQTLVLESSYYDYGPTLKIILTIDPSGLPAFGTPVNSYDTNTRDAWSWIIDPSCYLPVGAINSLNINQGNSYPVRQMTRNGITSGGNTFLRDAVLDVRVENAQPGFYYSINYFKNGTTLVSGSPDGFIIQKKAIADYSTTDTSIDVIEVSSTTNLPDIPRNSGIQTVVLQSSVDEGLRVYITLDPSKFPDYGTFVRMNYSDATGYSWIIDPSCYTYGASVTKVSNPLTYSSDTEGNMKLIWQSGDYLYRLRFGPNGYNNLPNIEGVDYAPLGDRETAVFTQINSAGTDWLPPMVVQAVNNGDGHGSVYTGGNHGADGGSGGGQTARNILYQIFADGQPRSLENSFAGDAKKITAVIVNELMAYNTTGTVDAQAFPARYVLRQSMVVEIHPGGVEVKTEVRAYEDIIVKTDNGVQMVTGGFQETMLYVGGQYENRMAFDSTTNSGSAASYPDCWALVLQSAAGQQVSWMDRKFEAGDGRYVGGTAAFIRGGGATNTKFYHAAVASYNHTMTTNATYKWRGGYSWQAPGLEGGDLDSTITFWKGGEQCHALIKSASNYTILPGYDPATLATTAKTEAIAAAATDATTKADAAQAAAIADRKTIVDVDPPTSGGIFLLNALRAALISLDMYGGISMPLAGVRITKDGITLGSGGIDMNTAGTIKLGTVGLELINDGLGYVQVVGKFGQVLYDSRNTGSGSVSPTPTPVVTTTALQGLLADLGNPLQSVVVTAIGDSICWGIGATGTATSTPRNKTLADPRNNYTSGSYLNLLRRWLGMMAGAQTGDPAELVPAFSPANADPNKYSGFAGYRVPQFCNLDTRITKSSGCAVAVDAYALSGRALDIPVGGYASVTVYGDSVDVLWKSQNADASSNFTLDCNGSGTQTINTYNDNLTHNNVASSTAPSFGTNTFKIVNTGSYPLRVQGIRHNRLIALRNNGLSGSSTATWLPTASPVILGDAVPADTTHLLIKLGTNDRGTKGVTKLTDNLKAIVAWIQANRPAVKISLSAPPKAAPEFDFPGNPVYYFSTGTVRDAVYRVATELGLSFVDLYAATARYELIAGSTTSYLDDGLHPNNAGYAEMFRAFTQAITNA